jgi:asparagine synthase (glutamine-hydrolysing)
MTRLSIIDLAGGHQPMSNADGSLWVVFNGEIYNHPQLRTQLGHRQFRTTSDTEVILHLYEEQGLKTFELLAGMFAIALWDRRKRSLILARDRLGIKPLYYAVVRGTMYFASEVQALLQGPMIAREVDPTGLRYYLALRAAPAPLTLFREVQKLQPGHLMVCDEAGVAPQSAFWHLERAVTDLPQDEAAVIPALREHVQRSVQAHLLSDVPVGALLSGGLDSSLIVACMRQLTDQEIHTFSVGFSEAGYHEFPYSRQVASRFATHHHEYVLTPQDFLSFLPQMVAEFADPVADPAAIPLYFIARVAREHGIKVVLSGEGSDELFAGYSSYQAFLAPPTPWTRLWRRPRRFVAHWLRLQRRRRLIGRGRRHTAPSNSRFYPGHAALPDDDLLQHLFLDPDEAGWELLDRQHRRAQESGMDALQTMLFIDLKTRIPEDLLCRTDRMTMLNSVEARVPFLDHRLVEYGFWLPSSLKVHQGVGKYVLKRAAEGLLPHEIIYRRKMGFPTPIRPWLSGDLRELFSHWLLDVREEPQLFDYGMLRRMVEEHFSGRQDLSLLLWRIWFFKLWFAFWVKGETLELGYPLLAQR